MTPTSIPSGRRARASAPQKPPGIPARESTRALAAFGLGEDLLAVAPLQALPEGRWWPTPVTSSLMWATLAPGDTAIVTPCHRYEGPGVYAFHDGHATVFYRAAHGRLTVDNPHFWGTHRVVRRLDPAGLAWFDAHVIGRVVASLRAFGAGCAEGHWSGEARHDW